MKHKHPLPAGRKYVPITNDKVFKLVFSEPANKDILILLLNILIPGKDIVDLTYLDKEHHGFVFKDKSTNFDVYYGNHHRQTSQTGLCTGGSCC